MRYIYTILLHVPVNGRRDSSVLTGVVARGEGLLFQKAMQTCVLDTELRLVFRFCRYNTTLNRGEGVSNSGL